MLLLCLKVILSPLLVAAATLAHRRWGPAIGGRLVGLPLTAAPLLILLSVAEGAHFTARMAVSDQAGDVAASAWCLVYAVAARRIRPLGAFVVAGAAFAVVAAILGEFHTNVVTATLLASLAIVLVLRWWPAARIDDERAIEEADGSDLLVRMLVAAIFTFGLSEAASSLGAGTAGLIGALPLVSIVLAVATHHRQGSAAVNGFLHGVMAGSFSVISFLAVVAIGLPILGVLVTFPLAIVAALVSQLAAGLFEAPEAVKVPATA